MGPGTSHNYSLKYLGTVSNDYQSVNLNGKVEKLKPDSRLWRDSGKPIYDIVESDEYWFMTMDKKVTSFIKKNDENSKCPPLLTRFEIVNLEDVGITSRRIEMLSCKSVPDDKNDENEEEEQGDHDYSGDYDYSNWECPYGNCKSGKCISRSFQSKE